MNAYFARSSRFEWGTGELAQLMERAADTVTA